MIFAQICTLFPKKCTSSRKFFVFGTAFWFKEEPSQFSMGQTAQSLTCFIMEKPRTGLDECPRILLSCFRARHSDYNRKKYCKTLSDGKFKMVDNCVRRVCQVIFSLLYQTKCPEAARTRDQATLAFAFSTCLFFTQNRRE